MRAIAFALPLAMAIAAAGAVALAQPADESRVGAGAWSAGTVVEPESVEEVRAAVVKTAAGFTFAIAREPAGDRVLGILRLPPADQDMLDDSRSVQIQIDEAARFEPARAGGGLKSTTFFLWDGVGEPVVGPLRDLMEAGQRIRVQYSLAGLHQVAQRTDLAHAVPEEEGRGLVPPPGPSGSNRGASSIWIWTHRACPDRPE